MTDIKKYFRRINFQDEAIPDISTLKAIHARQPKYIPFENIASFTGNVPELAPGKILDKLVTNGRGGYCYEQNLLLKNVLQSIGFMVCGLAARVNWKRSSPEPAAQTHMLLLVTIGELQYIADVGFGIMTLTAPLVLLNDEEQETPNGIFKITADGDNYLLETLKEKDWLPIYSFTTEPKEAIDYEVANWYIATNPNAGFVQQLIVSRVDEEARYSLCNQVLNIRYSNGEKKVMTFNSEAEIMAALQQTFGINCSHISGLAESLTRMLK